MIDGQYGKSDRTARNRSFSRCGKRSTARTPGAGDDAMKRAKRTVYLLPDCRSGSRDGGDGRGESQAIIETALDEHFAREVPCSRRRGPDTAGRRDR